MVVERRILRQFLCCPNGDSRVAELAFFGPPVQPLSIALSTIARVTACFTMMLLSTARFASFAVVMPERQPAQDPPLIEANVERIDDDQPVIESELPAAPPTTPAQHAAVTPPIMTGSHAFIEAALKDNLTELRELANVNPVAWNAYLAGSDQSGLTEAAASSGSLETLEWTMSQGCMLDVHMCSRAAAGGHLRTLAWARASGCPWDVKTCGSAAGGGHPDVLQWVRASGCLWDSRTFLNAAAGGHVDVFD